MSKASFLKTLREILRKNASELRGLEAEPSSAERDALLHSALLERAWVCRELSEQTKDKGYETAAAGAEGRAKSFEPISAKEMGALGLKRPVVRKYFEKAMERKTERRRRGQMMASDISPLERTAALRTELLESISKGMPYSARAIMLSNLERESGAKNLEIAGEWIADELGIGASPIVAGPGGPRINLDAVPLERAEEAVQAAAEHGDLVPGVGNLSARLDSTDFFYRFGNGETVELEGYSDIFASSKQPGRGFSREALALSALMPFFKKEQKKPVQSPAMKRVDEEIERRAEQIRTDMEMEIRRKMSMTPEELKAEEEKNVPQVEGLEWLPEGPPERAATKMDKVFGFLPYDVKALAVVKSDSLQVHRMVYDPVYKEAVDEGVTAMLMASGTVVKDMPIEDLFKTGGTLLNLEDDEIKELSKQAGLPEDLLKESLSAPKPLLESHPASPKSYAAVGEEKEQKPRLMDITTTRGGTRVAKVEGPLFTLVLYYNASKEVRDEFVAPAAEYIWQKIYMLYSDKLIKRGVVSDDYQNIEQHLNMNKEIAVIRARKAKKKLGMGGAVAAAAVMVGAGVGQLMANLPQAAPHASDYAPPSLSLVSDVTVIENESVCLPLSATGGNNHPDYLVKLTEIDNETAITEVKLVEADHGFYTGQLFIPGKKLPFGTYPLLLGLWSDGNRDPSDGYEHKEPSQLRFNVTKRLKNNLAPTLDAKLTKTSSSEYSLEASARDAADDEVKGVGNIQAYLDGLLLDQNASLKMKIPLSEEGDHELLVKVSDNADQSLEAVWKQILHRNYRPTIEKVVVEKTARDIFDIGIFYSDKDNNITKLPVRITSDNDTILYQELSPTKQNDSVKVQFDAREKMPGQHTVEVRAMDSEGEFSESRYANLMVENDPVKFTVNSLVKSAAGNDTWNYDINWSKPDASIYSLTVGFAPKDNASNDIENVHINNDLSARSGRVTGQLNGCAVCPIPEERDLNIKAVDEFGEKSNQTIASAIELENNRAWVSSWAVSENNNTIGNTFSVRVVGNDEDTSIVKVAVEAERDSQPMGGQSTVVNAYSFDTTHNFNFTTVLPGDVVFKISLTDSTNLTYRVAEHKITIADDDIIFKDVELKYNALPARLDGKKIRVAGNLTNPDDDLSDATLVLMEVNGSNSFEFPLRLKGSGKSASVLEELDATAVPKGDYVAQLKARGAAGKESVFNYGLFRKNESYEVKLADVGPQNTDNGIWWDYDSDMAVMATDGYDIFNETAQKDYSAVPAAVKDDFDAQKVALVDPSSPIRTGENLQLWLADFMPGAPGYSDDIAYASNMTAIFRLLISDMSKNNTLTADQRALWARTCVNPLTRTNNYYEALLSCDVNNDSQFDKKTEQFLLEQDAFIAYQTRMGAGQMVTETGYGNTYNKDLSVNRLLQNRFNPMRWNAIPSYYDVEKDSEQAFCDQTDHPTEYNRTQLDSLARAVIAYDRLGLADDGRLELKWDGANWKPYISA